MNISHLLRCKDYNLERGIFDIVLPGVKFHVNLHGEYEYQNNFVKTPRKFIVSLITHIYLH